jgi:hypothetical protein
MKTEIIQKRNLPFLVIALVAFSTGCASAKWCDCARYDSPSLPDARIRTAESTSQPVEPLVFLVQE